MKPSIKLAASLLLLTSIASTLVACGGGGSSTPAPTPTPNPDPSGSNQVTALVKTDTVVGTGTEATNGRNITVNYTGFLYNASSPGFKGTQFDSSIGRAPFTFTLGAGRVIAGWDQGVLGMKVGGKRTLIIPATLGYGSAGAGSSIPPNAALVFDVEVLAVQ